jgi:hypothetical protein
MDPSVQSIQSSESIKKKTKATFDNMKKLIIFTLVLFTLASCSSKTVYFVQFSGKNAKKHSVKNTKMIASGMPVKIKQP